MLRFFNAFEWQDNTKIKKVSMENTTQVDIEDYYEHKMCRRYGNIVPPHNTIEKILSEHHETFRKWINRFYTFSEQLKSIPKGW